MAKVSTLDRPLYSYAEAARLLELPPATLRWWLEGARRAGKDYPPVLRAERTAAEAVTWGEFVEAALLRGYRERNMSLQKMRVFIEAMRDRLGIRTPLAHYRPLIDVSKRQLVYDLQRELALPPSLYLVEFEGGQMELARPVLQYLEHVEFEENGPARRYWPRGKQSPIVIDPKVAFGIPQIRGVRTELVAELVRAGESLEHTAAAWNLSADDVSAAMDWENREAA